MQRFLPSLPPSWRSRVRELIARAARLIESRVSPPPPYVAWIELKPIDSEGEDTSLTEAELTLMR